MRLALSYERRWRLVWYRYGYQEMKDPVDLDIWLKQCRGRSQRQAWIVEGGLVQLPQAGKPLRSLIMGKESITNYNGFNNKTIRATDETPMEHG